MKYLKKITLNNFRCYENKEFFLKKGINIILGNNATGKTSLMEAIYMIGMCKSYRTNFDSEIVLENKNYYNIISILDNTGKNSVNYKSLSQHIGYLNVVVFSPEDLKLVNGDPKYRRRFLDVNISQLSKEYLSLLTEYNRLLKEKNELLKDINYDGHNLSNNNETLLKLYTNSLADKAKGIIKYRKKFIDSLNVLVDESVKEITKGKEIDKLEYIPNVCENDIEIEMNNKLKSDLFAQTTTCGPHRDDFKIYVNNKIASDYASQGQQKTVSLTIKMALAKLIARSKGEIVVILDDVFGELDEERQQDLIKLVKNEQQVFITTTSLKYITNDIIKESNLIKI
ncbi:MAG: hypothetical protein BHW12_02510 [Coprobacillus sp. 28_7]|nr:MAG: hypothetical protein BHW12_02510 [Coprobacillus sp. 28_7]